MIHPLYHIYIRKHSSRHQAVMLLAALLISLFTPISAMAEIVIGGNVYGGGNEGDVDGSTSVTVQHGTLEGNVYGGGNIADLSEHTTVTLRGGFVKGSVFGGARMANIGQHTFVHIDGEHQSDTLVVRNVYGGNDIAGTIGVLGANTLNFKPQVEDLVGTEQFDKKEFNAFVYTTGNKYADLPYVIGSLYGGGNGAYSYLDAGGNIQVTLLEGYDSNGDPIVNSYAVDNKPELDNTYIEIGGGFYGHVFGGGNNVTVKENTVIYAENKTAFNGLANRVCFEHAQIVGLDDKHYRVVEHHGHKDIYFDHHIAGLFGGNNLADMDIRPTWYLRKSRINNLYAGGNKGRMTHPNGIILPLRSDSLRVNNVYGGCRMADVAPSEMMAPVADTIATWDFVNKRMDAYPFKEGYASRVFITGGHYNNVYGGNDISGKVHYGCNVELHGGRMVNVYGGGNGSYAYTDQKSWVEQHPEDADFYYSIPAGSTSLEALHKHRPHTKNTLIYITGYEHENPLIVAGDVYCGGNSATLADEDGLRVNANATLRIGKHAIIDGVFLGSNGANMVTEEMFRKYADRNFSSIDLRTVEGMKSYLGSVAVYTIPNLEWDEDIDETYIGSLHYGGNKGSMTYSGMATINVPREIVIYEKVVGGCNDACVKESDYNAEYHGGLLEKGAPYNGMDNVKICLNVDAYLQPRELVLTYMDDSLFVDNSTFVLDTLQRRTIETYDNQTLNSSTYVDANIYGGCYTSGHVKGDVIINISKPLVHPKVFEDNIARDILHATGEDVYGSALAVYGGGYGELAVVEGSTQINLTDSASALLVFGGGEMGIVRGNTEVNFAHNMVLPTDEAHSIAPNINVYKVYAAGYAGEVQGHATLNLRGGGVFRGFGGACNADVGRTTTAIVGWRDEEGDEYNYGLPYVANAVFGGNDFGGQVKGDTLRAIKVRDYFGNSIDDLQVRSQSYLQYLSGNIGKALYGGSYGSYDYTRTDLYDTDPENGFKDPEFTRLISPDNEDVIATNTFVHIDSKSRDEQDIIGSATHKDPTIITGIVGGGRGYRNLPGYVEVDQTYVLLNGTDYTERSNATPMAYRVYGGGNLSMVHKARIDAYSGTVRRIFGGTHGVRTENMVDLVSYNVGSTLINYYESMIYPLTDIFGAGANSGSQRSIINLYGGNVNNVHGGAYTEGYTWKSEINVPENSTIHANAIFGGGLGEEEGRPCDVGMATLNYNSEQATVELGLFGGNNTARATKESHINISVPVRNANGILQSVYGAGYGDATIAGFTHIDLMDGARVAKVYGGGKEGKVYNHYKYYGDAGNAELDAVLKFYYDEPAEGEPYGHNANWTTTASESNTFITIQPGAVVENNVFGGGEGETAFVSGKTNVQLLGGLVMGDIYGGGDAGAMPRMTDGMNGYMNSAAQKIATLCNIQGGQVRKVFGGGLNGNIEGNTHVIIGTREGDSFANGIPAIQRNVYGGSERAMVTDTAKVDMYNGYIGFEYVELTDVELGIGSEGDEEQEIQLAAGMSRESEARKMAYEPLLDLDGDDEYHEFEEEGNIYGAGYGEGAVVIHTQVNLHGGLVRNSLYGGGEIAAVGQGVVAASQDYADITIPGTTLVRMYGGLVEGDVFGGGRGYTYTYTYTGEDSPYKTVREYTDGYVFGETDVEIYRGTIGTDESLAKGKGNVFGGGNIGYVYSVGKKHVSDIPVSDEEVPDDAIMANGRRNATGDQLGGKIIGHYYYRGDNPNTDRVETSADRTEDCRVLIQPLEHDEEGIIIRNAIFAGGNVSSGSDIVYANAVTVFGNVTASVVDLYDEDLVKIGGEHKGGLYGDGNLTFVDGYRELNLTNYGTDYYHLQDKKNITAAVYKQLPDHDKEYYESVGDEYQLREGRILNTIQRADFCGIFGSRIMLYGAQDRVPDQVDYTNYAINRVGEVSLNHKDERGNYLGIYNVAKFFGALTSDVDFNEGESLYIYKEDCVESADGSTYSKRNKGTSSNIISQASGTYLELVKELDEDGNKVYGYVTGVIELDLIGMNEGEGGGYVYAKKEYGIQNEISAEAKKHLTLSATNQGAVTSASFTYQDPVEGTEMQTSGNFVHDSRTILDEEYSADGHYWYVRGSIYNHDIIISAYAGSAQTFTNSVSMPLAISTSSMNMKLYEITTNVDNLEENEISNANGYVLNFAMNNPTAWNKLEPTFKCTEGGEYGQREYAVNNLISQTTYEKNEVGTAEFEPAYITIQDYYNGTTYLLNGSYISQTEYNKLAEETQLNYFEEAYICVSTLKKDDKEYALLGELISKSEYDNLDEKSKEHFQLAYVCTEEGKYGGKAFVKDQDYPASDYINLSADERLNFEYNVESAFDLLYSQYTETSFYTEGKTVESEPLPIIATAALYVPRESDITKLSKDRTVTAVYKHDYMEGDKMNTETHNVNIHIQFRSGQPVIGQLNTPSTVLPNSTIGLPVPTVTPGAYEVLGSGWEIYRTEGDANTHLNGTPYVNNATPMYWYQNGYYVAYYTKTYLGRSYSNPVRLSVANYHRMGEVMSHVVDGKHEYMYIDHADVERAAKIYLDSTAYASTSVAADSIHKNDLDFLHDLYAVSLVPDSLDDYVSRCNNLEFILRSDIAPKQYTDWTSIGTGENCFEGTLHGNGYTISGLNNSLFGNLCGSVYNLGVTGSFTGGGIADNGGGAENCWVYTSDKTAKTAQAVIGEGGTITNSYYRADCRYTEGDAIAASQGAFEMGEVAYLLNGFYLDKRYRNNNGDDDDNDDMKYVENYYADGDFRYAQGKVTKTTDERYDDTTKVYSPIYPDDYIYFGQRVTYAMTEKEANDKGVDLHDSLPRRIAKNEIEGKVRVVRSHGNRVYRAPAYKQSKNIDKIYFNSYAHFVDSCKNMPIHQNVTAIDLTGHNDNSYTDAANGYRPYLDYEGIELYTITDLTSNLLIYADPVKDASSYAMLEKLYVPVLVFGKNDGNGYVNKYNELSVQTNLGQVHGHLVDLVVDGAGNRSYVAKRNQILVDREDFNAPIAYTFDEDCYMWYQRQPERYAETDKPGWETLYLPFTANFTSTQDKGQITYFYGDSTANNEFWLREFNEVETSEGITTALFSRLDAAENQSIDVKNKFLYDYYYDGNDANGDSYQQLYYAQEERTKVGYPYIEANTPYIVAFPGKSYYEFDMSGQFDPDGMEGPIKKLNPQAVTFVSVDTAEIDVTDEALESLNTNYMGALTHRGLNGEYVLNADGSAFQNETGSIVPFRAYMSMAASVAPRRILIGNATEEEEPIEDIANRGLTIYGKKEAIYIESTLEYEATVTIYSLSGQVVSRVKVMPMSKEVVTVPSRGVYIANNRKVAVL